MLLGSGNENIQIKAIMKPVIAVLCMLVFSVNAQEKRDPDIKELSGISIIGNKEAPKSLYIVPWENSEVGVATSLNSGLLDNSNTAIDKEVFLRELDFYKLSHGIK